MFPKDAVLHRRCSQKTGGATGADVLAVRPLIRRASLTCRGWAAYGGLKNRYQREWFTW
jgi:hypothetical protein